MIIEIQSALALVIANSAAWFLVIFFAGFLMQKVPVTRFSYTKRPFRPGKWERCGDTYKKIGIRRWKALMPEAGGVFDGFGKRQARHRDSAHLDTFARETCRAEVVHYIIMAALPPFAIWNPPSAMLIMLPVVIAGNLPCIVIQRYNRPRLVRLIGMKKEAADGCR